MRFRRKLPILAGILLIAVAVAVVVFLRKHAPPEAARLLPQGDGFVYINLKHLRRAKVPARLPEVSHDPEYEQFIQATGFQFEDDLDEVAFAVRRSSSGFLSGGFFIFGCDSWFANTVPTLRISIWEGSFCKSFDCAGERGGARTHDPVIKSQIWGLFDNVL